MVIIKVSIVNYLSEDHRRPPGHYQPELIKGSSKIKLKIKRLKLAHLNHGGKMDKIIKAPGQRQSSQRVLANFVRIMHSVIL